MTSFGATKICDATFDGRNFENTFKIQDQVYQNIGYLMPILIDDPKFLQICFLFSCEERVTNQCQNNLIEQAEERAIVGLLEDFVENRYQLIHLFKSVDIIKNSIIKYHSIIKYQTFRSLLFKKENFFGRYCKSA